MVSSLEAYLHAQNQKQKVVHLGYAMVVAHRMSHSSSASSATGTFVPHVAAQPPSLLASLQTSNASLQVQEGVGQSVSGDL